mmetsp:Transcript_18511/g.34050  ORF Transcript_18511/g.34050 Transcript_18511/m.34050 type:complete len:95 (-) Transcript_18511:165-449(-)|eukprot:CAMPEP_0201878320 /NCGR_PEP_ID=MMETSP0902-20130614/9512_1 /ASSEMBLY_ACC=CAM_ASM_000551 /TAXON_ID=420261 /ORGANISM="Thalassiosira antarctica, Strain CCMP982" /LENGTH=94 /DNA_ID=CAMNT_0048405943 /DNA_START=189 /DNA_END=473 /DNA_ORIENTATION=-
MGLHIPSALVGSVVAGSGFLLIHRELSHRRRLTTKWALQEYAEDQWKVWKNSAVSDSAKKNISSLNATGPTAEIASTWNKGVASLRGLTSQEKE